MSEQISERLARAIATQVEGNGDAWRRFTPLARLLIDEMRSATPAMAKAGADIPVGCCMTNMSDAREVWEYMIDAARAEADVASAVEEAS